MIAQSLKIYPDPVLRQKAEKVEDPEALGSTICDMADIMRASGGIGLAAPQVGLSKRIFIIDVGEGLREFINPQILERSRKKTKMEEGCLSVPGIGVTVSRPDRIKVRAQDSKGSFFTEEFTDLAARAIQHENDHLNGRLILDYLDPIRHLFAAGKFRSSASGRRAKTCEVTCNDGKRHTRRA